MFNMFLAKFGYLAGTSLPLLNVIFLIFRATPQCWLTQKGWNWRITNWYKNSKPVDVYLETGFENLSHLSFAFKNNWA